ncbi:MAG: crotonyl-CoA carboxylase/reductase, partial [bacterium]
MSTREIYDIGELPPLGEMPERMHASVIRPERFGPPVEAFQLEEIPVPRMGHRQVMVYVMAAGINYNNVWAALGQPVDVIAARGRRGDAEPFHIGGSEASGI